MISGLFFCPFFKFYMDNKNNAVLTTSSDIQEIF